VPDSSINSWESWFNFNLRKIKSSQQCESTYSLVVDTIQGISIEYTELYRQTHNHDLYEYLLEQPSSCSTSRIPPSWPRCRLRLSLLLVSLSEHAFCYHAQPGILLFISMGRVSHLTPSLLFGWLLTNVHRATQNLASC
jgi:hypothetical protein